MSHPQAQTPPPNVPKVNVLMTYSVLCLGFAVALAVVLEGSWKFAALVPAAALPFVLRAYFRAYLDEYRSDH